MSQRNWYPVESSNIAAVDFEPDTGAEGKGTLYVKFTTGKEYQYFGVPNELIDNLKTAESVGKYFNQYVKAAGYAYARMN